MFRIRMKRKDGEEYSGKKIFGGLVRKRSVSQKCVGYGMDGSSGICKKGMHKGPGSWI